MGRAPGTLFFAIIGAALHSFAEIFLDRREIIVYFPRTLIIIVIRSGSTLSHDIYP
jgi:hypothetical protein